MYFALPLFETRVFSPLDQSWLQMSKTCCFFPHLLVLSFPESSTAHSFWLLRPRLFQSGFDESLQTIFWPISTQETPKMDMQQGKIPVVGGSLNPWPCFSLFL